MLTRDELEARYEIFDRFLLKDQKAYYHRTIERYQRAAGQVSRFQTVFSFLAGMAAALTGLIHQVVYTGDGRCAAGVVENSTYCTGMNALLAMLAISVVALPAIASIFSTLADLYQWDRVSSIYETAVKNLEVADALSPSRNIPDEETYRKNLEVYAESTLTVMNDETAQWGQSIRTPEQLERFVEQQHRRARDSWQGRSASGRTPSPKDL